MTERGYVFDSVIAWAHFPCPHCGFLNVHRPPWDESGKSVASMLPEYRDQAVLQGSDGQKYAVLVRRTHALFRCARCTRDIYRLFELRERLAPGFSISPETTPAEDGLGKGIGLMPLPSGIERHLVVHQYPAGAPFDNPHVPESVRKELIETEKCFAIGAWNACGTMARRTIDAIAQDKGAVGRDTFDRLADLKAKQEITPELYDMAEEARVAGKIGAHPEWEELPPEKVEYVVRILRKIVEYVYVLRGELDAMRIKGNVKRKDDSPR